MGMPIPVNLFVQEFVEQPYFSWFTLRFYEKSFKKSVKIFAIKYRWNQVKE
jgi:hypothetical protein